MARKSGPSSSSTVMGADELTSACVAFWAALGIGDREAAGDVLLSIRAPRVETETFSYPSPPGVASGGGSGSAQGVSPFAVAPDTPNGDLNMWNHGSEVALLALDRDRMCLAKVNQDLGDQDFTACVNWLERQPDGKAPPDKKHVCTKAGHRKAPSNANKNKVNAVEKELERLKKLNKSWQT